MVPAGDHGFLSIERTVLIDCVNALIQSSSAVGEVVGFDYVLKAHSQTDGLFVAVRLVNCEGN